MITQYFYSILVALSEVSVLNMLYFYSKNYLTLFICHYRALICSFFFGQESFQTIVKAWFNTISNYTSIKNEHALTHDHIFENIEN
jgi:hypothetical protein